jgi:hypothetical protein
MKKKIEEFILHNLHEPRDTFTSILRDYLDSNFNYEIKIYDISEKMSGNENFMVIELYVPHENKMYNFTTTLNKLEKIENE